jgi:hypothetical protein
VKSRSCAKWPTGTTSRATTSERILRWPNRRPPGNISITHVHNVIGGKVSTEALLERLSAGKDFTPDHRNLIAVVGRDQPFVPPGLE